MNNPVPGLQPATLEGKIVRLEPLSRSHHAQLCRVGLDADLWKWTPNFVGNADDLMEYIENALKAREEGTALPFAIIHHATGSAIGSTRYLNIDLQNRRLEIGATWIGKKWQRTPVNTEAKYLLLRHAFEEIGCNRVELKTDSLNFVSRNAILRIGAKEEGTLRKHMVTSTGRVRDTVYFSIIDTEWPSVKEDLEVKLARDFRR